MADLAEGLPLRVAQVTHALMARWKDAGGQMVTTLEVCEYDETAPTPGSTYSALCRAMRRYGLADGYDGLWFPTNAAWDLRRALEDRVLGNTEPMRGTGKR